MRKQLNPVIAAAVVAFCFSLHARADIAYNNYGEDWAALAHDGTMITAPGTATGDLDRAFAFTAEASGYVADVWACLTHNNDFQPGFLASADLLLMDDNGGEPGQVLETFHFEEEIPWMWSGQKAVYKEGAGTTHINSGQLYWMVCSTDDPLFPGVPTYITWGSNPLGETGWSMRRLDMGAWDLFVEDQTMGAFRIDVTPEPSTLALLGLLATILPRTRRSGWLGRSGK